MGDNKEAIQFTSFVLRSSSHDGGLFAQFEADTLVNLPKGTKIYYSQDDGIQNSYQLGTVHDLRDAHTVVWILKPGDPKNEHFQEFLKKCFIDGKIVNLNFEFTDQSDEASGNSESKWKGYFYGRKTALVCHANVDLRVGSIQAMVTFRNPLNVEASISEFDVGVFLKGSSTRIATVKRDEGHALDLPPSQEVTRTLKLRLEHYLSLISALHKTEVDIKIYSLVVTISNFRFPLVAIDQMKVPFKAELYGAIPLSGLF